MLLATANTGWQGYRWLSNRRLLGKVCVLDILSSPAPIYDRRNYRGIGFPSTNSNQNGSDQTTAQQNTTPLHRRYNYSAPDMGMRISVVHFICSVTLKVTLNMKGLVDDDGGLFSSLPTCMKKRENWLVQKILEAK